MARKEKVAIPPLEEHKALAREMNEVMKLDPPIKFSKKTTADELLEIINNEATGNIYEIDFEPDPEDDSVIVFSEKAEDDFKALGIEVLPGSPPDPAAEADEPDEEVIEEKPAAKPDTKKGGKKEEPTKKDEDVAVINKQHGLVVHPAPGNYEHTLVNALLHRFKKLSDINPARPGIVHRLDKETSGLLVIARNNSAHLNLAKQFAEHSIERRYVAVVSGKMEFDEHVIEASIGRHPFRRTNMSVSFNEKSKYARTHYKTLKRNDKFSLLELKPFTGRTHQLRVHMAFLKHPIMGDSKYGNKHNFSRLALHAKDLGFTHPGKEKFVN